jgi:MFS family permease
MLMTTNTPLLGLAFFLVGLGESLVSGADSALLYDSLRAVGREDDFQEAFGTGLSIMLVSMVLGTIACGYLVDLAGLATPMWTALLLGLAGMVPPLLFVEPPFKDEKTSEVAAARSLLGELQGYLRHTRDSLRQIMSDRTFLILAFVNIVIVRMCLFADRPFAQPYLMTFGYDAAAIGYLYAIFLGVSAFFSKYSGKIVSRIGGGERNGLITVCVLGAVSLVAMVQAPTGVVLAVALVGLYLVRGLTVPFVQAALNRRLTSEKRASCLSMAKMGMNFMGIFGGPVFGWLADEHSLRTGT